MQVTRKQTHVTPLFFAFFPKKGGGFGSDWLGILEERHGFENASRDFFSKVHQMENISLFSQAPRHTGPLITEIEPPSPRSMPQCFSEGIAVALERERFP